jgi:hypothetical protein
MAIWRSAIAPAPPDELDEREPDEGGEGDAAPDEEPRRYEAVPHRPLRTAVRDELGRTMVRAGTAVLPGLAAGAVLLIAGARLVRWTKERWAAWTGQRKGNPAIVVKVIPAHERVAYGRATEGRVVDMRDVDPFAKREEAVGEAKPSTPRPPKEDRRKEFLAARAMRLADRRR